VDYAPLARIVSATGVKTTFEVRHTPLAAIRLATGVKTTVEVRYTPLAAILRATGAKPTFFGVIYDLQGPPEENDSDSTPSQKHFGLLESFPTASTTEKSPDVTRCPGAEGSCDALLGELFPHPASPRRPKPRRAAPSLAGAPG
jgi:hypothetical protein